MSARPSAAPVRIIGSRELHQNLPAILQDLERDEVRYVLTVHGKPRAVLIGARPYMKLTQEPQASSDAMVGLQLSALLGGEWEAEHLVELERALDSPPNSLAVGGRQGIAEPLVAAPQPVANQGDEPRQD